MPIANKANLEITATDKASGKIKKVGKNAKGLGGQLGGINKMFAGMAKAGPLAAVATAVAVGGVSLKLAGMAKSFDKSFTQVMTLLPGTSKRVFDGMKRDIKGLSRDLGVNLVDATTGLYNALSAGVPQKNILSFMETASKAAIAGGSDLTTTVTTLAQVMNVYGVGVEAARDISDKLFTTVKLGMTTLPELSAGIANVLPISQSLGVSFGEVSSMLAVLTASTGQTAESITRLRSLFTAASKDTSVLSKAIKSELGASFADLIASGRTTSEIMQDLRDRMPLEEFRNLFRRTEAQSAALLITGENAIKVSEAYDQMKGSIGATAEAFRVVDESMSQSWDKSIENLKTIGIELGEKILPIVVDFLDAVVKIVDKVGDFVEWIGGISVSPSEKGGPVIQTGERAGMQIWKTGQDRNLGTGKQAAGAEAQRVGSTLGMTKEYYKAWSGQYAFGAEALGFRDMKNALRETEAERIELTRVGRMTDQGPGTLAGMVGGFQYGATALQHGARLRQTQGFEGRQRGYGFQGIGTGAPDFSDLAGLAVEQKAAAAASAAAASAELVSAMAPLREQTVSMTEAMLADTNRIMERAEAAGIELDLQNVYNEMLAASSGELEMLKKALEDAQTAGVDYSEELSEYNERLAALGIDWQNEVTDAVEALQAESERQAEEAAAIAKEEAEAEKRRMDQLIKINAVQVRLATKSLEEIAGSQALIGMTKKQMAVVYEAAGLNQRNEIPGMGGQVAGEGFFRDADYRLAQPNMVKIRGGNLGAGGRGVEGLIGSIGRTGVHEVAPGVYYSVTVEGNIFASDDSGRAIVEAIDAYAVSQGQTSAEVLNAQPVQH